MSIFVKVAEDYERDHRTVDLTKVTKEEYTEVDESVPSVQNLLEAGILVKKEEESSKEETEEDGFECEECGDEFDSKRGLKAHKGQVH